MKIINKREGYGTNCSFCYDCVIHNRSTEKVKPKRKVPFIQIGTFHRINKYN